MKNLMIVIVLVILGTGCKKAIKNTQEDIVILAMTDGRWKVSNFTQNGNNITTDFTNYRFKYYSNRTVDAINNGTVEKTGTWQGNSTAMTMYADFPGAAYPIILINGSWNITRNGWTYVEASQNNGTEIKTLRLDKE